MPSVYYTSSSYSSSESAAIPGGKTVKFYTLSDTSEPLSADSTVYTGITTTGGSTLSFTLPDSLKDQNRYIFAVVILSGTFDLQGKTRTEIATAMKNGQVLFGKATDTAASSNAQSFTLTDGGTISYFTFLGI